MDEGVRWGSCCRLAIIAPDQANMPGYGNGVAAAWQRRYYGCRASPVALETLSRVLLWWALAVAPHLNFVCCLSRGRHQNIGRRLGAWIACVLGSGSDSLFGQCFDSYPRF